MQLDDHKKLALKLSFFNSFGFIAAVSVTSYVDPLLYHHVMYGSRSYKYGYWTILYSLFILLITYFSVSKTKSVLNKIVYSFMPLLVAGILSLWAFKPEFPHGNITVWVSAYSFISVVTVWIRYHKHDLEFISNNDIAIAARIEALKNQSTIWQTITIAITGGYLAVVVNWFSESWKNGDKITSDPGEMFLLNMLLILEIVLFSFYVVFGPIKECLMKTLFISKQYANIYELKK